MKTYNGSSTYVVMCTARSNGLYVQSYFVCFTFRAAVSDIGVSMVWRYRKVGTGQGSDNRVLPKNVLSFFFVEKPSKQPTSNLI